MRNFLITGLLFLTGLFQTGQAQNLSNRGKEFWIGYGHHQFFETGGNTQEMVLYLSAEQAATVTVSINGTTWTRTYNIAANTVIASDYLPKSGTFDCRLYSLPASFGGTSSEGVFARGIHIESNVPIVAYAHIFGSASSGASMLMPVETWGYNYVSVNFTQSYANNCFSWMNVIAKENNTKVTITPSVPSRNGRPANVPFDIILNKGEVYQLLGANSGGNNGYDLTGTTVKSVANSTGECFPVATISGSSRTYHGISCSPGGGDNVIQQVFPSQAWGKRYLTAPTSTSTAPSTAMTNYFRVVVKDPTTVVKRNGVTLTGLVSNTYYQFSSSVADYITADKPILVSQYMPSSGCYGGNGTGDPEMFYISPIEQAIKRVGFYRNTREAITTNYLTLIIPTAGVFSLKIDGSSAFDYSYPHPNLTGYTVVIKRWTAAQAQATVTSDSAFTAITYGLGSVESYGYNAGTLINNLNVIGAIKNTFNDQTASNPFTCKSTPFIPSVSIAYKPTKMVWKFSRLDTVITPFTDVTDLAPSPADSQLVNGTWFYRYNLSQAYTFSDTGTYDVPIILTHPSLENCNNSEEVKISIIVRPNPTPDYSFTSSSSGTSASSCIADTLFFSGNANAGSTGLIVNRFKWNFSTAPGDTSNIQNPKKLYSAPGTYNVKLSAITTEGCLGDTVKAITIHPRPGSDFTVAPASICENGTLNFTTGATYAGPAPILNWHWNYGNGQSANNTTNAAVSQTYTAYGSYTIKHVVRVSNLCVSDTVSKTVTVYANPRVDFTYPLGCLAPDGTAQFTDATVNPDNQTLTYSWNFGDPNATVANPNTSTLQNPAHKYTTFGTYRVILTVSTGNGCTKSDTANITFSVRPTLAFAPIASVCINNAPLSIANGSVTNGVPGTGKYRGPGTDTLGFFRPAVAGVGIHTIWYVFTGNGGCTDSVSQTVRVHPKPAVAFTVSTSSFCADDPTIFTDQSTVSAGSVNNRYWDFGDGTNAVYPNNNPITRNYTPGSYNVKLYVVSDSSCVSDTLSKPIVVNPVATLAFAPLASVCVRTAPLSVAKVTVTNGVAGSGVYSGPGTNTTGIFNPAVAGAGLHTIKYVFTANGGCADSIMQTIRVNYSPSAAFAISTSSFCADATTTLTDQSTIAGGIIRDRHWDFGDGTNAIYPNNTPFTRSFTAGSYNVRLYVISDSSCVSDTVTKPVVVNPVPVADFDIPASICMPAGRAQFTNRSTIAGGTVSYNWNFGDLGTSSDKDPLHIYSATGPYTVSLQVTSVAGCTDTTSKLLSTFYAQPVALFNVSPDILCQGTSNIFTDQSTATNSTIRNWNWTFGDGSRSTVKSPIKKYSLPGTYTISLNVESTQGCLSDTFKKTVFVYLQPLVNAGPSFTVPENTLIRFAAIANDTTIRFQWTPGFDLSNDTILTPTLIARTNQIYYLTATGDGNCTASDSLTVKVLRPFTIPNTFSPNGDGINDTWAIPNLADYFGATVEIYDRYGHQVLRQTGYSKAWDGRYEQKPLPIGTYYYIINPKNGFPPLTGSVTIIR